MADKAPLFSVIVPVYNISSYIGICLDSIYSQTFTDYELIVVDDGSTDDSSDIVDSYKDKFQNIKIIHKQNGGLVSARKEGLKHATGKYIICVDGDDLIERDYLYEAHKIIASYGVEVVCFGFKRYINNEVASLYNIDLEPGIYNDENIMKIRNSILVTSKNFVSWKISPSVCCKIIRHDLYEKYQKNVPNSIIMGEDMAVTFPCIMEAKSIYISDKCPYLYRLNEQSVSYKYRENEIDNLESVVSYIEKKLGSLSEDIKKQLALYIIFRIHNILGMAKMVLVKYSKFKKETKKITKKLYEYIKILKIRNTKGKKLKFVLFLQRFRIWRLYYLLLK